MAAVEVPKDDGVVIPDGVLLGMGNPLLDLTVNIGPESDLLTKYGLEANNAILAEEKHLPIYKELMEKHEVVYTAGGATQNSIRVAQWMLGYPATHYIGCIGKDEYGTILNERATSSGVKAVYQIDEATPTGTCAVIVSDNGGARSLVANISAANNYKIDHFHNEGKQCLEEAKVVYISGFFLTVSPETILEVGKHVLANEEKTFAINLAAPFICQFFKDPLMATMPYADIVFGNIEEFRALSKALELGTEKADEIALKVAALPKEGKRPRIVILTHDEHPVHVATEGKVITLETPLIPKEEIVDTNAAGDAYVGGFLAALLHKRPMEDCHRAACFAAKIIIGQSGCLLPDRSNYTYTF